MPLTSLRKFLAAIAMAIAACAPPADAANLRIASAFDPQTMDPHSLVLLYHTSATTSTTASRRRSRSTGSSSTR